MIGVCNEPSAAAVPPPSGTSTKLQHVPVQLTRLPTTVDQDSVTGAFGIKPLAVSWTRERIAPLVELNCTREPAVSAVRFASDKVVRASIVGLTTVGHSTRTGGTPASFVTVNLRR